MKLPETCLKMIVAYLCMEDILLLAILRSQILVWVCV